MKQNICKGDKVKVMRGNDRGKAGTVLHIDTKRYRATVKGISMRTLHKKPTQKNPKGQRIKQEGSIHLSNLMLLDPEKNIPTRIGRQLNEKDKLQRYAKKSGQLI